MSSIQLAISLLLAVALVALARAYAGVGDKLLDDWARARGVELTAESRPMVAWYLRTARVLRTWGAIGGAVLPSLVELAWDGRTQVLGFGTDGSAAPYAGPMGAYIGYLVGALYAELSLARPVASTRRAASIVPRELPDYLPRRLLYAQRGLALVAVLGLLAIAIVPYDTTAAEPGRLGLLAGALLVVAFAAGLERLQRWLVRRPQPFTSPSLVAADDAIRAQSVHALAGGGLALLLALCSGIFVGLAASDVAALRWTMWLPALVAFVLSVRACLDVGQRGWRVRRSLGAPATSAT
ncbi:MAG: hypothetical protein QOJ63_2718 [Solirubrobacteraceae bacterium]|jgi:hypothetical protein|nr:hypothetical protein [Solirubrobacteraceae bacterium]